MGGGFLALACSPAQTLDISGWCRRAPLRGWGVSETGSRLTTFGIFSNKLRAGKDAAGVSLVSGHRRGWFKQHGAGAESWEGGWTCTRLEATASSTGSPRRETLRVDL